MTGFTEPMEPRGTELFPDISEEIDRRIKESEGRIKYWVIGGVLAQVMSLLLSMIPAVFYLGQISRDISAAGTKLEQQQVQINGIDSSTNVWVRNRLAWEAATEQWMVSKGYVPPRRQD